MIWELIGGPKESLIQMKLDFKNVELSHFMIKLSKLSLSKIGKTPKRKNWA